MSKTTVHKDKSHCYLCNQKMVLYSYIVKEVRPDFVKVRLYVCSDCYKFIFRFGETLAAALLDGSRD